MTRDQAFDQGAAYGYRLGRYRAQCRPLAQATYAGDKANELEEERLGKGLCAATGLRFSLQWPWYQGYVHGFNQGCIAP